MKMSCIGNIFSKLTLGQERALETSSGENLERSTSIDKDSDQCELEYDMNMNV